MGSIKAHSVDVNVNQIEHSANLFIEPRTPTRRPPVHNSRQQPRPMPPRTHASESYNSLLVLSRAPASVYLNQLPTLTSQIPQTHVPTASNVQPAS
jgi:hypothetical protein